MEKLRKITAAFLLATAMATTVVAMFPSEAYAKEAAANCGAATCAQADGKCAEVVYSILFGLITITTTCYGKPA